jgi:cell division septum initiation protein DivIVA
MNTQGTIKTNEIAETANKLNCFAFKCTTLDGKNVKGSVSKKDFEKNLNELLKTIKGSNAELFLIEFSSNGTSKAAKNCYHLIKDATPGLAAAAPVNYNYQALEPARSLGEAVKDARELAEMKSENKRLQDEITRLKLEAQEADDEADEKAAAAVELAEKPADKISGYLKEILPSFLPLAEKYLEIKAMQAQTAANALIKPTAQATGRAPMRHPFRPLPNISDNAKIQSYFNFVEKLPEHLFNREVQYLQTNAPGLAQAVIEKFTEENLNEDENE